MCGEWTSGCPRGPAFDSHLTPAHGARESTQRAVVRVFPVAPAPRTVAADHDPPPPTRLRPAPRVMRRAARCGLRIRLAIPARAPAAGGGAPPPLPMAMLPPADSLITILLRIPGRLSAGGDSARSAFPTAARALPPVSYPPILPPPVIVITGLRPACPCPRVWLGP